MRTEYKHDRHECSSFTTRDECLAVACVPTTKLDTNRNSSTSAMFFDKPCNAHTYEMPCFRLSLAEFAGPSPRWAPLNLRFSLGDSPEKSPPSPNPARPNKPPRRKRRDRRPPSKWPVSYCFLLRETTGNIWKSSDFLEMGRKEVGKTGYLGENVYGRVFR